MPRRNPDEHRALHIATESFAAFAIAPALAYIAYRNPQLPRWQRLTLYTVAVGTVAVDGFFLSRWLRQDGR